MIRTQIQLAEEQTACIKKVAKESPMSMAEAIRRGVETFLQSAVSVDKQARTHRALAAAGRYRSGTRDGSRHHDRCLAEAYRS